MTSILLNLLAPQVADANVQPNEAAEDTGFSEFLGKEFAPDAGETTIENVSPEPEDGIAPSLLADLTPEVLAELGLASQERQPVMQDIITLDPEFPADAPLPQAESAAQTMSPDSSASAHQLVEAEITTPIAPEQPFTVEQTDVVLEASAALSTPDGVAQAGHDATGQVSPAVPSLSSADAIPNSQAATAHTADVVDAVADAIADQPDDDLAASQLHQATIATSAHLADQSQVAQPQPQYPDVLAKQILPVQPVAPQHEVDMGMLAAVKEGNDVAQATVQPSMQTPPKTGDITANQPTIETASRVVPQDRQVEQIEILHELTQKAPADPSQAGKPAAATRTHYSSPVVAHIAEQLRAATRDDGSVTIRLKPQGLGIIEIEIARNIAGAQEVTLRVQNPQLLDIMKADQSLLQSSIFRDTMSGGSFSMGNMGEGKGDHQRQPGGTGSPPGDEGTSDAKNEPVSARQRAGGILI